MSVLGLLTTLNLATLNRLAGVYQFAVAGKEIWVLSSHDSQWRLYRVSKSTSQLKMSVDLPHSTEILRLIQDTTRELQSVIEWRLELANSEEISFIIDTKHVDQPGAKPEVSITLSAETAVGILWGEMNPQTAFMQGKIRLTGNMALAMKLITVPATLESRLSQARL
jgi:putative sterol carrier protein